MHMATASDAATLLSDSFDDGERATASFPSSAAWISAGDTEDAAVSSGSLAVTADDNANSNTSGVLTYLTPAGERLSLDAIGSTLSVNYTLLGPNPGVNGDDAFQVWFYDSAGSRISTDGLGFDVASYRDYSGYGLRTPLTGGHPSRFRIGERPSGQQRLTNGVQNLSGVLAPNLAAGQSFSVTGSLTLERLSSTETQITATLAGSTAQFIDSASAFSSFDTLAFISTDGRLDAFAIDNVSVTYAVPEPASFVIVVCGAAVVAIGRGSRHKAAGLQRG